VTEERGQVVADGRDRGAEGGVLDHVQVVPCRGDVDHVLAVAGRDRRRGGVRREQRLVDQRAVDVGLGDRHVLADQRHLVVRRNDGDRALLVGPRAELVERLRRGGGLRVGGVGGGERRAAVRRLHELADQGTVAT